MTDAVTANVALSATLVVVMVAVTPAGAPVTTYMIGLVRPPDRTALMDVLAPPPGDSEIVDAPTVSAKRGSGGVPPASVESEPHA